MTAIFPILLVILGLTCNISAFLSSKLSAVRSTRLAPFRMSSTGYHIARDPSVNQGHSFSQYERGKYGLRGLFPAGEPMTLDTRVSIAMNQLRLKTSPIEKYQYLHTIQDSDETLFYAILVRHTTETMPIVYTPTVGEACQKWGHIFKHTPRGVYISSKDRGHVKEILRNYPLKDIKVIVVTDGERILGLGDQGVNGMGIPIGKLALYTACAGIHPSQCLPVHIDVGTDREEYRNDPAYMGLRQPRERGAAFDSLMAEFMSAAQDSYRDVLIQFEDFGNTNAFRLLEEYQDKACCFNDDIQGTASVVLAGIISSLPLVKKSKLSEHTYLFYGAGEAGVGIASQVASYIQAETKCSEAEARGRIWLVDSKGLITNARTDKLAHHKTPFAHSPPSTAVTPSGDILLDAVRQIKPTALIGVSAQGASFTETICKEMATFNKNPVIFALSNPTSKAECTAQQAYEWTNGNCVFASGSPFDPVTLKDGRHFVPGQGNNAYIFPGVGLAAVISGATKLTDQDLTIAAVTLAKCVTPERLATGCAYPPLSDIREVSLKIAVAVAHNILTSNRGDFRREAHLKTEKLIEEAARDYMYEPSY